MIRGVFTDREARVPLVVSGSNAKELGVAAILDTGFSGFLTLPVSAIEELGYVCRSATTQAAARASLRATDFVFLP